MHPHTLIALRRAVLLDLRVSPSTASSMAPRIGVNTQTVEQIAKTLIEDELAETRTVAETLTVYRATEKGLQVIA